MLYPKLTLALLPIISLMYLDFYIKYKTTTQDHTITKLTFANI